MTRDRRPHSLGGFARAGFQDLSGARDSLTALSRAVGRPVPQLLEAFGDAADPDAALARISAIAGAHPGALHGLGDEEWPRLTLLVGASPALGDFFARRPERLVEILARRRCGGPGAPGRRRGASVRA